MKVYISGKIGEEVISDATREKFAKAKAMLRATGRFTKIFDPTDERWQEKLRIGYRMHYFEPGGVPANAIPFYDYVMLKDLMALSLYDAVYFLDDWEKSPGANTEHSFAMATGKKMLWSRLEDAQVFHNDNETAEDVWLPL